MHVYVHVYMCICTHIQIVWMDIQQFMIAFSECQDNNNDCRNTYLPLTMCQGLSAVQIVTHLGLKTTQLDRYYYPKFINEETGAQRDHTIRKPGPKHRQSGLSLCMYCHSILSYASLSTILQSSLYHVTRVHTIFENKHSWVEIVMKRGSPEKEWWG